MRVGFANETSEQLILSKVLSALTVEKTEEEEIHEGEKATSQKDSDATAAEFCRRRYILEKSILGGEKELAACVEVLKCAS